MSYQHIDELLFKINQQYKLANVLCMGPTWLLKISQKYQFFTAHHYGIQALYGSEF
jgi:hypothetical protein